MAERRIGGKPRREENTLEQKRQRIKILQTQMQISLKSLEESTM